MAADDGRVGIGAGWRWACVAAVGALLLGACRTTDESASAPAGADATAGSPAPAPGRTTMVFLPGAGRLGAQLVDPATGATTDVGDATGASADGRYVIGPAGERRDRLTGTVVRPDLGLDPGDRVQFQDASADGSVYVLTVTSDTAPLRRVLVDATTARTTEPGAMGVSPDGRYVAFEDRIVERAGDRVRRVLPDGERALDVADDGSHLVWSPGGGPSALRALDGTLVRADVPLPTLDVHLSGDLRLALVEDGAVPSADAPTDRTSRLAGASIVDPTTGAALVLADTTIELSIGMSRVWALAADGDTAVVQTRYCPNLLDCSADPPQTIPGLRDRLAAASPAPTTTAAAGS